MPEGTHPRQVHEEAFREVFGPEHSGRVRCLGAGALPSQVFHEQYKRSHYQGYDSASDVTEKFKEMEEKLKEMEARETEREAQRQAEIEVREAQWQAEIEAREAEREARRQAEMEAWEAQRQTEMEQMMRHMQEQLLQNFTWVAQSMMVGTAGGSRGPELLPAQMTNIMQQYTCAPSNAQESTQQISSTS